MTTQYMDLDLPVVSQTAEETWAIMLNAALTLVDSHDHSDGKGSPITPAGMEINADLPFGGNSATDLLLTSFSEQNASLGNTFTNCLYVVNGSLYYNNNSGVAIQVTTGTEVNAPGSGVWGVTVPGAYPYDIVAGDAQKVILVDTTSARTINLPAATTAIYFEIKDTDNNAQTNNITVVPDGTDTIDGNNNNDVIDFNGANQGYVSDGVSAWYKV